MDCALIIAALRTRCSAVFSNRVAGAAEFKQLQESAALSVPAAFVIPLDDDASERKSQNTVRQDLTDGFGIIVAVSNVADERGQTAAATIHTIRAALWAALMGWRPAECYTGIIYEGGQLLAMDRARLWWQFEFSAAMEIGPEDGYQQTELIGLPHFDGAHFNLDCIDPADPNIQSPGPDGRIEAQFSVPQDPDADLP
ncbi:MAG: hypothetical protein H6R18_1942 [Proteobacteria bacterium]|nr:hypothetical protein [Pseudomonadota bacterium]